MLAAAAPAPAPAQRQLDVFDLRLDDGEPAAPPSRPPPAPAVAHAPEPEPAPAPEPAPPPEEAGPEPARPPPKSAPPPPPPLPEMVVVPIAPKARPTGPPVRAFSDRERPEAREQRLRDIIVAHRPEMKLCVDRQLKLSPNLHADGTFVIEVDATGAVPRSELVGTDLAGTPLEDCLRTIASRWRFPAAGRPYRVDAPVRVWGSESGR
jgi:hypothetical protein